MTTDETYYWVWSENLQLSYYDHPPFIAWLFWLGHPFEFLGNAVRWPTVLMGHLTLLVWLYIWKETISENLEKYSWWIILALFSPLIGFGSLILTPDIPLIFFWSLSLLFFFRILQKKSSLDYILLGVFLGLGFCSKYHIVIFVIMALIYLFAEKKWKEINFRFVPYTLLFGFIFSLPVLIWNFEHDFISFQFQLKHGLAKEGYEFYWTWSYVLAQFLVLFPSIVWVACKVRFQGYQRAFLYFAWGPLIFFFLTSFKGLVEVNWPIVAYPAFFVLAVLGARRITPILSAAGFCVGLFLIIVSHLLYPWIPQAPEKIEEFDQFKPILAVQSQYQPLYASTYQMASWLWYTTKVPTYKLLQISRFDFFDTLPQAKPQSFPFFVALKKGTSLPLWIGENSLQVSVVDSLEKDLVILRVDRP